ncbi:MAG: flavodoxin family protein [Cellulosilyticum sp.]|nr:flavodoxin family protein [Cellulosilyticum sp.]
MSTTILYETLNDSTLSSPINYALRQTFTDSSNYSLIEIIKDQIKPCIGCFGCWLKNPGHCILNEDLISQTTPSFAQSDYIVLVSPIYYGCYSATMKRVIDRSIPNLLPFFRKYKNEIHHEIRYKKLANQIILAYGEDLSPNEKDTFTKLTKANATNFGIPDPIVYFCSQVEEIPSILEKIKKHIQMD